MPLYAHQISPEKKLSVMIPFSQIAFVAKVVTDRVSGYSKGFGFVRYATLEDSAKGIAGMDGKVLFILISIPRLLKSKSIKRFTLTVTKWLISSLCFSAVS